MKRTAAFNCHIKLKAKMVDFAGWEMPVMYNGIIAEHKAVRSGAGLFDIGHMGAVSISGPTAAAFLQRVLTNDITKLAPGYSHYSLILNSSGGVIDDIFVYKLPDSYLLVINASNTIKDLEWLRSNNKEKAKITDLKPATTLFALQGPKAEALIEGRGNIVVKTLQRFQIANCKLFGKDMIMARTGYTGEDGFELFVQNKDAESVWNRLIELGATPCGLGARDTLRLEACMPLYGHEYDETMTPQMTPFMFAVKMEKGDFIGRDALLKEKSAGITKKLVSFKMTSSGIPRQGYSIFKAGRDIGMVSSGTMSPTLGKALGMGYVPATDALIGNIIDIDVRGKMMPAEIVKPPFYKRSAL